MLHTLIYSTGSKDDEGIIIYCDQEKEHELLGAEIVRWHEARLNNDFSLATNSIEAPRSVSVHYGPKRKFIPLQLADILANDTFGMARNYLETGDRGVAYFTSCLNKFPKRQIFIDFFHRQIDFKTDHASRSRRKMK